MIRLLLAFWLLQAGPQGTGVVTGVVRSGNGTPAVGVRVYAVTYRDAVDAAKNPPALDSLTVTDAAGKYRLEIPAGRYHIASGSVASPTYYPGTADLSNARIISVAANDVISGIDFGSFVPAVRTPTGISLTLGIPAGNGVLSGTLRYPDGSPASGIQVMPIPASAMPQGGLPRTITSSVILLTSRMFSSANGSPIADSSGRYRIENLGPETYYLVAGYADAPVFFPGTPDLAKAKTITTTNNSTIDKLDFEVQPTPPGVTISGKVLTFAGFPAAGVGVRIQPGGSVTALPPGLLGLPLRNPQKDTIVGSDGTFIFRDVAPGSVKVEAFYSGVQSQIQNVIVTGQPLDSLQLVLPLAMVTGRILMEDGSPVPNPQLFGDAIVTTVNDPNIVTSTILPIAANGTFTRLHEGGEYRFYLRALPEEYEIQSMRFGAADLTREALKITGKVPVEIEIRVAKRASAPANPDVRVSGTVLDAASGLPVAAERVILCCRTSGPVERFSAPLKADGSFEFAGVPPDNYIPGIQAPAGKPNIYVVEPGVAVGSQAVNGLVLSTTPRFGPINAGITTDGLAPLPEDFSPSVIFTGPMGRFRVVAHRNSAGNYLASVPTGVKYGVSVENLPEGYVVKSVLGEALAVTGGALNAQPVIIVVERK